ncbi:hypothetical protein L484_000913 [Morus notabilis]|uniref:Uncharacterized protein n=1 Tax=Morus notabilis TaxID=981085 RepID=W9SFV4_9ROSA|nr:hypothetical protein L484_000913 [Morus notabilis]
MIHDDGLSGSPETVTELTYSRELTALCIDQTSGHGLFDKSHTDYRHVVMCWWKRRSELSEEPNGNYGNILFYRV